MASVASVPKKRKQPPTFRHFPAERAKKLQKAWIEKKKVMSKWRREKQKLGQSSLLPVQEPPDETTSVPEAQGSPAAESDVSLEDASDSRESTAHFSPEIKEKTQTTHQKQASRGGSSQTSQPRPRLKPGSSSEDQRGVRRGRGRGRGTGSRGRAATTRVRRQPDMRAKMGSLLEKIQKTYAS